MEYFAPLSSPKRKHLKMKNTLDFYKLDGGNLGAINFNNMIPVYKDNYHIIYLKQDILDLKYKILLTKQLNWLNENIYEILHKSSKLYNLYISNKLSNNIKEKFLMYQKEFVNN